MNAQERIQEVLFRLRAEYGDRKKRQGEFIHWSKPLELVIGTVLSAQCTDERVNMVTAELFKKYTTAQEYADADLEELQQDIGSITFYKSKSKYLKGIGEILVEKHGGEVPGTMEELIELPGVAKKTASLIMAKHFGEYQGVAVDTHVKRLCPRLDFSQETNPDKISRDLEELLPQGPDWLDINEYLILHGRAVCSPRKPKCGECSLQDICPAAGKIN